MHPSAVPHPFYVLLSFVSSIVGCLAVIKLIPRRYHIFDVGHYFINPIANGLLPEYLIFMKALTFLVVNPCFFCLFQFLWLGSMVLWARMFLMWITTLPCLIHRENIPFHGIVGGHNDYLPLSGHTAASLLLSFYLYPTVGVFVYLTDIWLGYLLLAMRRHYSIEIVLSFLFTAWLKIEAGK
jgi:hypothetical protein